MCGVTLLLLLCAAVLAQDADVDSDESPPAPWRCPELSEAPRVSCACDLPHTLRCTGDSSALQLIARRLRDLTPPATVSLLDCTIQNMSALMDPVLEGVSLHGLVVSSGEVRFVSDRAFTRLAGPLQALGLPNNMLDVVPTAALAALPTLDRLDLSHNRLHTLETDSFRGLKNLSFLELSDNSLTRLKVDTFKALPSLRALRLRGNRLGVSAVIALRHARGLQELDLGDNLLTGPLSSKTLPRLPNLKVLQLSHNQLTSVRHDALTGFASLSSLSLHHNQIDVLEDHAFRELGSLTQLDLAHNGIVAVSGSSLAHLTRLVQLDLAHNFLRALTADLVVPLQSLRELRLDDNDISIVTSDAMASGTLLRRLTLGDNPLNCDCSLSDFATWLTNTSQLSASDRATAVCATPPSLENGLLEELTPEELLCGEDQDSAEPAHRLEPLSARVPTVSGTQVTLRSFQYDGYGISLMWNVDASTAPYACDALFVYEEVDINEVLLESNPLRCNSSQLADPRSLTVKLPTVDLQPGHRYRYCVVLLESGGKTSDEMALVLGCSDIIPLVPTSQPQAQPPPPPASTARIAELHANVTSPSTLSISMVVWDRQVVKPHCEITVEVFSAGILSVQRQLNCSLPRLVLQGLPPGPYRVCATTGDFPVGPRGRCVSVQQPRASRGLGGFNFALAAVFVTLSSMLLLGVFCVAKRLLMRPKMMPTHQCFLAPSPREEQQHSRYVKLQATTKL